MNKIQAIINTISMISMNKEYEETIDDILKTLYKKMETLQLVPICIVENFFNLESFDMVVPTNIESFELNDHFILFDDYFIGDIKTYYFQTNSMIYRVDVFYDKEINSYKDFVEISYFEECPKWLKKYENNVLNSIYK